MSRKLCCICLALSVFISTVSIAYADSTSITHPTAEDYRQAVAYLETAGLQTGFDSARTSTQRLYSADLPAGGQDASVTQLSSRPSRPPGSRWLTTWPCWHSMTA